MEVVVIEDFEIPCNEYECEFCTLEFQTSSEWNDHIIQHFKQKECTDCGKTLILVGDTWFGQHTTADCCTSTEEDSRLEPDFIDVKQEEIFDIEEEIGEEDDIFDDEVIDDEEEEEEEEEGDVEIIETPNVNVEYPVNVNTMPSSSMVQTEHNRCPLCNKTFTNEQSLIHHINQHNGFNAQPYSLTELKKQKKSPDSGKEAESIGLTEEQLSSRKCPICEKFIVNKQNLICHMNIHRGTKPFVCSVCRKSFAHIRNLVRHKEQQRHCEMQFKCNTRGCKKSFMSSNKLHRHIKLAHLPDSSLDKPYPCDKCQKSFMTLGFLKLHLKRHQ